MDRWTEMELPVHTAELGSMSRTAQAPGPSNAAASRHLAAMEKRIGAHLLRRSTRGPMLTDVDQNFCQSCKVILENLRDAEAAASIRMREQAHDAAITVRRIGIRGLLESNDGLVAGRLVPRLHSASTSLDSTHRPAGAGGRGAAGAGVGGAKARSRVGPRGVSRASPSDFSADV